MRIKSHFLGLLIVVVMLGGVFGAQLLNLWNTKGQPGISSGGGMGALQIVDTPEDIRGSFRLGDISAQFDIPLETMLLAFGLDKIPHSENITSGSLEDFYEEIMGMEVEIGNGSVKLFVALYNGFPYNVYEPTFLPQAAVTILQERGIDDKWQKYILKYSIVLNPLSEADISLLNELQEKIPDDEIWQIKGSTTFQQLMEQGVSQKEIESVLSQSMPNPLTGIKSWCEMQGVDYGYVKKQLEEII